MNRRSHEIFPLVCIFVAVLLANLPGLLHLVTSNPQAVDAYLNPGKSAWLPGRPYIDPNSAFTTQALGHLATVDWINGHIPWWNPYEGLGAPLAGEMQSGAFFLPTFLLLFHQGMLYLQIFLETVTGAATYLLARRLGVGRTFSIAAGVAFGLCGSYAWLTHAPVRPILLLPLSLLGVERALTAARAGRPGGWRLLGVALAFSILAGFPETTFIDGIFVAWWAVIRMSGPGRECWRKMVAKLVAGVAVGVALAAPLLVAFLTFLPHANLGGHGPVEAHASLPPAGLSQLILPYSLGPIFGFRGAGITAGNVDGITALWGSVGGYLTVTLVAAGLVGLAGRRNRRLRVGLGAWILLCLLRTFGFAPVVWVLAAIPGINSTAFYRYADASWELALVVLAVLGMDDVARRLTPRRVLARSTLLTAGLVAWAGLAAWTVMARAKTVTAGHHGSGDPYIVASWALAGVVLAGLLIGGWRSGGNAGSDLNRRVRQVKRRGRILAAGAICAESVLLLGFTYASAPPPSALQLGSVAWLQTHLGTYRFATLGPIQPNYGSSFGIAQANTTDLPIASDWVTYVNSMLDTNSPTLIFTGAATVDPQAESPADEFTSHLANFEAIGVRYVVTNANGLDVVGSRFPTPGTAAWPTGPRVVYRDSFAEIWQLPTPAPLFSLLPASPKNSVDTNFVGAGCSVTGHGWDQATVTCSRPSVLLRQVEDIPGWSASVNGNAVAVQKVPFGPKGLFQEVPLPAGTSTVQFNFLPPYEFPAFAAVVLGLLAIIGSFFVTSGRLALPRWRPRLPGPRPARPRTPRGRTVNPKPRHRVSGPSTRLPTGPPRHRVGGRPEPGSRPEPDGGPKPGRGRRNPGRGTSEPGRATSEPGPGTSAQDGSGAVSINPPTSDSQTSSSSGGRSGQKGSSRPRLRL
ncbi:MAG TPA: hypothetical protein VG412_03715 [Acidimicrobiales bacterium]|nr:hypothetical protein [Acidimicrobiales bacterium]